MALRRLLPPDRQLGQYAFRYRPVPEITLKREYARANPGKLSCVSSGIGNLQHLAGELLNGMAGADILHVPCKDAAPALTDVAAGRVSMNFSPGPALPLIQDCKLLTATSRESMPQLPDVPAIAEASGFSDCGDARRGRHG